jgi:tetratricopeptide (TPR) repeat protein
MDLNEIKNIQLAIHDLINQEKYDEALPLIYSVLEEYPNEAATLNFLGYIWLMGDKPAFAYQFFRRALQEMPGNKAIWTSLGRAAHELNMYEDALKYFLKSAELDPTYALAYSNAAATLVQTWHKSLGGKFRKEWVYGDEVRWDGTKDKTLIIYGEQGLGDEIFYGSCIPDAISSSKQVYIDCDPRLEGLFKRSFPEAEVHGTRKEDSPEWLADKKFDYRCAIGGLPQFFRHTNKDFPGTPYLKADPERRTMWRGLFDSWGKKVIGLTTKGGIKHTNAKGRELTQEDIEPLLKLKDYVIVSLDYSVERKLDGVKYFDFATSAKDYDDTAALIAECDMVLGVNTTAQHCAAAMGVKTWCLVPTWHQWRYAQPSMPWYRHMRIIYQDNDTWKEVINKVAKQLNGTW